MLLLFLVKILRRKMILHSELHGNKMTMLNVGMKYYQGLQETQCAFYNMKLPLSVKLVHFPIGILCDYK